VSRVGVCVYIGFSLRDERGEELLRLELRANTDSRVKGIVALMLIYQSGRLLPLEHWDHGFESHSSHGCLCAFILWLSCSVCR
jgi:hypothetical protein